MYKLVILLGRITETPHFQGQWPKFLERAESMPHLRSEATARVDRFLYGHRDIVMIHELFFESQQDLNDSLESEQGQAAGKILHQISRGQVTLLAAEHKEDTIENLHKYREKTDVDD